MKKYTLVTKEGLENFQKQHKELTEQRKVAVKNLSIARDMGDRSENAAYVSARQKLSALDRQLRHLNFVLQTAKVAERRSLDTIEIGCTVELNVNSTNVTYSIVGSQESDVMNGKISFISPLGKALLGKKKLQTVQVETPKGLVKYTVLSIS